MKASKLIIQLENLIFSEGDLDVIIYADHGQKQMVCCGATIQKLDDSDTDMIEIYGGLIL